MKGGATAIMRIRLLPVLIFVAALLVSVRAGHFVSGVESGSGGTIGIAETRAETAKAKGAPDAKTAQEPAKTDGAAADKATAQRAEPQGNDTNDKDAPPGLKDPNLFSASEIQMLQRLAERRDELDARDRALVEREKILKAIEGRITEQLAALKASQDKIQSLLKAYDEQEAEKMKALVKIYETMKPAEAARIFEKLDNKVLLEVLQQMKTAKSAPIFAAMNPVLAREMTQALAERGQLPRDSDKPLDKGTSKVGAKDRPSQ